MSASYRKFGQKLEPSLRAKEAARAGIKALLHRRGRSLYPEFAEAMPPKFRHDVDMKLSSLSTKSAQMGWLSLPDGLDSPRDFSK